VTISLLLTACDKSGQDTEKAVKPILALSDANAKQFKVAFYKDYVKTQKALLEAFHRHQKAGDSFGFTQFRNTVWTPAFIEKKNTYQAILDKNRTYIDTASIKPMFLRFENLIYIGINLKNGLLDDDQELLKTTLAEASADKRIVKAIASK